jgi:ATP-dependent helicase/nuclease subunit B
MVATPLLRLRDAGKTAKTAAEQAHAFYEYLEAIKLPETLDIKAAEFLADGEEKLAAEYVQLWEITVTALETVVDVLADTPMEQDEFGKLFTLLLAQYELATIPTMLHRVKLGDFDTLRETPLKCLIILGATDTAIPNVEPPPNLLSPDERRLLSEAGTPLLHDGERDLKREMYLFRKMLSKPSEQLVVTLPQGERVTYLLPQTDAEKLSPATDAYVSDDVQNAVAPEWSKLTADSVRALYGERLTLSATRIDKFNSCKLSYFLQFGLRANTRKIAEMNSLEFGNLAHFVLERVSRDVKLVGGFKVVSPEELRGFASAALDAYADERLRVDLESGRFKYLFSRLRNDVIKMVLYIAEELSQSNFIPQDFELKLPETDLGGMLLTGKIDRVDALTLGDTLYLRVADYKTGKTSFSLSDVYYGLGMQMLIYLYALTADNEGVKPGGVIYTPTSDILLSPNKSNSLNRNSSQQEIDEVRRKQLTGSGLVLNTLAPEAKKGLVTLEQLGSLTRHVERSLEKLGKELSTGGIDATPYIKGFSSNAKTSCDYCEYSAICGITKSDTAHKRKLYTLKDNEVWEKFCDNEQL